MSRKKFMRFLVHDFRQSEEPRADSETGLLGRTWVDFETNSIFRPVEIRDSSGFREAFLISNTKDTRSAERGDGGAMRLFEVTTDEEDVATTDLQKIGGLIDFDGAIVDRFSRHRLGNNLAKICGTQHADHHGRVARIEGILRPFDIACKIEQKGGHDLVFGLRDPLRNDEEKSDQRRDDDADWRPVSSAEDPFDLARSAHA